jgi:hypothetical protein
VSGAKLRGLAGVILTNGNIGARRKTFRRKA